MPRHAHTREGGEPCPGCESPVAREDIFCGACGAYLDWESSKPSPPRMPPPPAAHRPVPDPEPHPKEARHVVPATAPRHGSRRAAPRAARSATPVTADEEPRTERTIQLHVVKHAHAAPLLCPALRCRRDNSRRRHFCRHCGEPLHPPLEPEPQPWWRRIADTLRTRLRERPAVWHRNRTWYVLAGAAGATLMVVLAGGGPWLAGPMINGAGLVRDRFAAKMTVVPSGVSASSAADGFPARSAADGVDNRAWAPKEPGTGARGEWWEADFPQPFRLTSLVIVNGVSHQPKDYLAAGRPNRLRALAITAAGRAFAKELSLADSPGPQTFNWGLDDVKAVRLEIVDVRGSGAVGAKEPVGLAEVQFFTRKG